MGIFNQILVSIYHLHEISNIHTKFDNNQASSLEITSLIKVDTDPRQTDVEIDRQIETRDYFFRILGVMKRRENIKVAVRPITIVP